MQRNESLRFHRVENNYLENDQLIAYSKQSPDGQDIILTVVNLDPVNVQSGWVQLPLAEWGIAAGNSFYAHDLLSDARYTWNSEWDFVRLDPASLPVHIFHIQRSPTERNFDYYM